MKNICETESKGRTFSDEEKSRIYLDYRDKVTRYVRGKIADSHEAEDVVSSVFLRVYERLDSYDPSRASLSTWIYTITRNVVVDYFRSHRYHAQYADYMDGETDEIIDGDDGEETLLEQLADALSLLKERERDLIVLHYYKGHTLKRIADMMGMSYVNAKVIHAKALASLREHMHANN